MYRVCCPHVVGPPQVSEAYSVLEGYTCQRVFRSHLGTQICIQYLCNEQNYTPHALELSPHLGRLARRRRRRLPRLDQCCPGHRQAAQS